MCKKIRIYGFICSLLCAFLSGCSKGNSKENVISNAGITNYPSTEIMERLEDESGDYLIDDNIGEANITYNGGVILRERRWFHSAHPAQAGLEKARQGLRSLARARGLAGVDFQGIPLLKP